MYLEFNSEASKIILIALMVVVGILFIGFIIHTLRCYLNKPKTDEDDEFAVEYKDQRNNQFEW